MQHSRKRRVLTGDRDDYGDDESRSRRVEDPMEVLTELRYEKEEDKKGEKEEKPVRPVKTKREAK